jgi:hypothetical protein
LKLAKFLKMASEETQKIQKNLNLLSKIRIKQSIVMNLVLQIYKDRLIIWVPIIKIIWNQKTYRVFADQEKTQIIRKITIEVVFLLHTIIVNNKNNKHLLIK